MAEVKWLLCDSHSFSSCLTYLENKEDFYFTLSSLWCHRFVSRVEWKMLPSSVNWVTVLTKGCPDFILHVAPSTTLPVKICLHYHFILAVMQNTRILFSVHSLTGKNPVPHGVSVLKLVEKETPPNLISMESLVWLYRT